MIDDLMLFGIHATKSSTSFVAIGPRYAHEAVRYLPSSLFTFDRKLREDHIWSVISCTVSFTLLP